MTFRSFEEALKICLTSETGSGEQDEALVYCLEHAPEDLKEMLRIRFVEFHTGRQEPEHRHGGEQKQAGTCGCGCPKQKPGPADFIR